jgi:hypothetical protein
MPHPTVTIDVALTGAELNTIAHLIISGGNASTTDGALLDKINNHLDRLHNVPGAYDKPAVPGPYSGDGPKGPFKPVDQGLTAVAAAQAEPVGLAKRLWETREKVASLSKELSSLAARFGAEGLPEWTAVDKRLKSLEAGMPKLEKRINGAAFNSDKAITDVAKIQDAWDGVMRGVAELREKIGKFSFKEEKLDRLFEKVTPLFERVTSLEGWKTTWQRAFEKDVPELKAQGLQVLKMFGKLPDNLLEQLVPVPRAVETLEKNYAALEERFVRMVRFYDAQISSLRTGAPAPVMSAPSHPYRGDTTSSHMPSGEWGHSSDALYPPEGAIPTPIAEPHTRVNDGDVVFKLPRPLRRALQGLVSAGNEARQYGNERGLIMAAKNVIQVYEDYVS